MIFFTKESFEFSDIELNEKYKKIIIDEQKYINFFSLKFWQEYYYLFYLSLKIIHNYYKNDSMIISIGESPMKLIFAQSLFYADDNLKIHLQNFPNNLSFNYLPISKLSLLLMDTLKRNSDDINNDYLEDIDKDNFITNFFNKLNNNFDLKIISSRFLELLIKYKLDPKNIIESNKNHIFIDRGESFSTIKMFLFLYYKSYLIQYGNNSNINMFTEKIKLVTFDGDYTKPEIILLHI